MGWYGLQWQTSANGPTKQIVAPDQLQWPLLPNLPAVQDAGDDLSDLLLNAYPSNVQNFFSEYLIFFLTAALDKAKKSAILLTTTIVTGSSIVSMG